MNIKNIIQGHYKEFINAENELAEQRLAICKTCPLYTITSLGATCNKHLWLNTTTNETSNIPEYGFTKGCGCRLNAKTRIPNATCPTGKW